LVWISLTLLIIVGVIKSSEGRVQKVKFRVIF